MAVLAGEIIGVFAHVQGADEDRPRRFEAGDQGRIGSSGRAVAIDARPCESGKPGDVNQVLDREGYAR
jgi:hypothetical protein